MAFFFYNNRKPRKFSCTPILYNEKRRKKKLEKRILEIKREMGVVPDEPSRAQSVRVGVCLSDTTPQETCKERSLQAGSFTNPITCCSF